MKEILEKLTKYKLEHIIFIDCVQHKYYIQCLTKHTSIQDRLQNMGFKGNIFRYYSLSEQDILEFPILCNNYTKVFETETYQIWESPQIEPTQIIKEDKINKYFQIAAEIGNTTIEKLKDNSRKSPYPFLRGLIAKTLRDKGYTLQAIGEIMHRNHATIVYYINALDNPKFFKNEEKILYNKWYNKLNN